MAVRGILAIEAANEALLIKESLLKASIMGQEGGHSPLARSAQHHSPLARSAQHGGIDLRPPRTVDRRSIGGYGRSTGAP